MMTEMHTALAVAQGVHDSGMRMSQTLNVRVDKLEVVQERTLGCPHNSFYL